MHRRSRFAYGSSTFETTISVRPWTPRDSTVGGTRVAGSGVPATYVVRRDNMVSVTLRLREDQWEDLLDLVAYGQAGLPFIWYPDANDLTESFTVYLHAPAAGSEWEPTRGELPRILEATLTLRSLSGSLWRPYFVNGDEPPAGAGDNPIGGGGSGGGEVSGDLPWIDAEAEFGVVADGVTDTIAQIDDALDHCVAHMRSAATELDQSEQANLPAGISTEPGTDFRREVRLPRGAPDIKGMVISSPIWLRGAVKLVGGSEGAYSRGYGSASWILPSYDAGPWLVVGAAHDSFHYFMQTPGIAGPGTTSYHHAATWAAVDLPGDAAGVAAPKLSCIDFRVSRYMDLDGLPEFTLAFLWKSEPGETADEGVWFQSVGRVRVSEAQLAATNDPAGAGCFRLQFSNGSIRARIRTTDGVFETPIPDPGDVNDDAEHLLAMDYDGAFLRAYVDDEVVGSVAATGELVQDDGEGVFGPGCHFEQMPYVQFSGESPAGHYGNVKFSKVAKYAGVAPGLVNPTGFDADEDLLVLDWATWKGPCVRASTPGGFAWLTRLSAAPPFATTADGPQDGYLYQHGHGATVEGIAVAGVEPARVSGVFIQSEAYAFKMRDVSMSRGVRYGVVNGLLGNNYEQTIERVHIDAWGGLYGYVGSKNDGLSLHSNLYVSNGKFGYCTNRGSKSVDNVFVEMGSDTVYGAVINMPDFQNTLGLSGIHFSAESGTVEGRYIANLLLNHGGQAPSQVSLRDCQLQALTPSPLGNGVLVEVNSPVGSAVTGDSGSHLAFDNCAFFYWGGYGNIPPANDLRFPAEELIHYSGGKQVYQPAELRGCAFPGQVPKTLSLTPGGATMTVKGLRVVPFFVGADIAFDAAGWEESGVDDDFLSADAPIGAIEHPLLVVGVGYYRDVAALSVSGVALRVDVDTVVQLRRGPRIPWIDADDGQMVMELWYIQTHDVSVTHPIEVQMSQGAGAGNIFQVGWVSLANVMPEEELTLASIFVELPGIWRSNVVGSHDAHQNDYETRRAGEWVLDFLIAGGSVDPTADGGQTERISENAAAGPARTFGASTKPVAAAAAGTVGWTFEETNAESAHVALTIRPARIVFDCVRAGVFKVTLTDHVLASDIVNLMEGQEVTIIVEQDEVGGWDFAWPASMVNAPVVGTDPGERTTVKVVGDSEPVVL
jgi:hypothetical protein